MKSVNIATLLLSFILKALQETPTSCCRGEKPWIRGTFWARFCKCLIRLDAVALFTFERIIPAKHLSRWPDDTLVPEQMVPSGGYKWPVLVSIWHAFYSWSGKAIFRWVSPFSDPLLLLMNSRRCEYQCLLSCPWLWGHASGKYGMHIWMPKDTQHKLFLGYQVAHNCRPPPPRCLFSLSFEHQRSGCVNITSPLPGMQEDVPFSLLLLYFCQLFL